MRAVLTVEKVGDRFEGCALVMSDGKYFCKMIVWGYSESDVRLTLINECNMRGWSIE